MNAPQLDSAHMQNSGPSESASQLPALLLLGALAAGAAAQGGYYAAGRALVTVLAGAAAAVALRSDRGALRRLAPVLAAAGAFCLWATVRGITAGAVGGVIGTVATVACLLAALLVPLGLSVGDRVRLLDALLWTGVAVAVTGWVGVAWRLPRFVVFVEHRVWRGSGVLTYPNAAAALLVALILVALALPARGGSGWHRAVACYLMLVGLGATLSRAGVVGLLVGLVVLGARLGPRAVAGRLAVVVPGTLVAVAALAPSFPATSRPHPGLALLGLGAGALVALGPVLLTGRSRWWVLGGTALAAGGTALVLACRFGTSAMRPVLDSRWTLSSFGRSEGTRAALHLVRTYPLAGTGVGESRLVLYPSRGGMQVAQFVHDEYLQVLVDLGVVGLVLVLALLASLAWTVWTGRPGAEAAAAAGGATGSGGGSGGAGAAGAAEAAVRTGAMVRAGAVAALVALAVHSGFDFLWHITVLPLLAGLLVGMARPAVAQSPQVEVSGARSGAGGSDVLTEDVLAGEEIS